LDGELEPTGLRVHAHPRRLAVEVGERSVEHLHVHRPDVAPDPVLEYVDEEPPVLAGADGTVRDETPLLYIERTARHLVTPASIRDRKHLGRGPLDDRDQLYES